MLLDDALALEQGARSTGSPVELHVEEGMVHCWHLFGGVPEADTGVADVAEFVLRCRSRPHAGHDVRVAPAPGH